MLKCILVLLSFLLVGCCNKDRIEKLSDRMNHLKKGYQEKDLNLEKIRYNNEEIKDTYKEVQILKAKFEKRYQYIMKLMSEIQQEQFFKIYVDEYTRRVRELESILEKNNSLILNDLLKLQVINQKSISQEKSLVTEQEKVDNILKEVSAIKSNIDYITSQIERFERSN